MAGYPQRGPYTGSGARTLEDLLGNQDMSTGPDVQAFIQNLLALQPLRQGITNEVDMGPDPYEGNPNREPFPEELDPYQVAGDVVPMRTHPPAVSDVNMRLRSPGVGARSQGMQSIERFGGDPRSIDLLGVLEMMTGREPGR